MNLVVLRDNVVDFQADYHNAFLDYKDIPTIPFMGDGRTAWRDYNGGGSRRRAARAVA